MIDTFCGLILTPNSYMVERKQVRFGKSRKKRHRRKQAKNPRNWATVPSQDVYRVENRIVAHPAMIEAIRNGILGANK